MASLREKRDVRPFFTGALRLRFLFDSFYFSQIPMALSATAYLFLLREDFRLKTSDSALRGLVPWHLGVVSLGLPARSVERRGSDHPPTTQPFFSSMASRDSAGFFFSALGAVVLVSMELRRWESVLFFRPAFRYGCRLRFSSGSR